MASGWQGVILQSTAMRMLEFSLRAMRCRKIAREAMAIEDNNDNVNYTLKRLETNMWS